MSNKISEYRLFDFDYTIYDGDATLDFYKFCIKKNPKVLIYFPLQVFHYVLLLLKIENRTRFKGNFLILVRGLKDLDRLIEEFWSENFNKMKSWYLKLNHSKDIIISASPEIILRPVASRLKVYGLIATQIDKKSGRLIGPNCHGKEKVVRLRNEYGNLTIGEAYSDSKYDHPILKYAKKGYVIKDNRIKPFKD